MLGAFLAFSSPIGITVGFIGVGLNLVSNFFKSKDKKRRIAVDKISSSLRDQVNKQKSSVTEKACQDFEKCCEEVLININSYFSALTEGLGDISTRLEKAQKSLDSIVNYLNSGYAKRIIDWSTEKPESLNIDNVKRIIAKVDRNFGQGITVKIKGGIELKKSLEEIKQVIQEDISIESY